MDEALLTIANIPVSEANYGLAWSSLVDRFNKLRKLAVNIVEELLSCQVHTQESLSGLKEFLVLYATNVSMLKTIPDLSDFLLFALLSRCLSLTTRCMFESSFMGDYPIVDDLIKFDKVHVSAFEVTGLSAIQRMPSNDNIQTLVRSHTCNRTASPRRVLCQKISTALPINVHFAKMFIRRKKVQSI